MKEKILPFIQALIKRKWPVWVAVAVVLIGIGGGTYLALTRKSAQANASSSTQTTTARRGDLVISISGTGTLAVPTDNEENLAFTSSGQVTQVNVKPGDVVKQGDVLAEIDSSDAQASYDKAKLAYDSLISDAAIASAQQAIATAKTNLNSAQLQLEYLLSPDVVYWETEIDNTEHTIKKDQAALQANPSDASVQQDLTKAEAYLDFAKENLASAQKSYTKYYVPEHFTVTKNGTSTIYAPTDLEIATARAAIGQARTDIQNSQELYDVLTGGPVPDNPTSADVISLLQAKKTYEDAQTALDGTKIVAPISGTIMQVNTSVGQTIDTSTAIVMADLSQLYVQTSIDESDYGSFVVGNTADVVFDALPNQTFTGKVSSVDPTLDTSSGSAVVSGEVKLDPTNANLLIGMSASVEVISAEAPNAVLVSVNALHKDSSGQYSVYVMENGKPVQRKVEVGLEDLVNAEIKSGLNPGDVVVINTTNTN